MSPAFIEHPLQVFPAHRTEDLVDGVKGGLDFIVGLAKFIDPGLLFGGVAEASTTVVRGSYDTQQKCQFAGALGKIISPGWTEFTCTYDPLFGKWILNTN
jgi:hypothetical protein